MKLKLIVAILFSGLVLYAQPVFEHSYSESAALARLENLGEVYYSMDVIGKQCLIYDLDHSLLKSIVLPTPEGYYLEDIQFLSEHLFNDDDLLELIYIYSKYVSTELSYYFTFESKLINENGAVIQTFPGVGFTNVIQTADQGRKFLAYQYDYSVIPYRTYTHVYKLPETGGLPESYILNGFEGGDAFPNPASDMLTIPVTLPEGAHKGSLKIVDIYGREILSYPVVKGTGHIRLPVSQLPAGSYLYHIETGTRQSVARKIIIR